MVKRCLNLALLTLTALAVVLPLAACGKRADFVSPPQGEEADTFPRTYPSE
jgi:hypothetical protein